MTPTGNADSALLTKRSYEKARRRLKNYGSDIQAIRAKGFAALSSSAERGIFRGMFATLSDLYREFMLKWDELYDFNDVPIEPLFPTPEDENYLREIKNYYYECHNYHQQITASAPPRPLHNSTALDVSTNNASNTTTSRAILPKIHIKPFDGDIRQWPTFKQLFTSLIKEDNSISDAERFHYLVGLLSGTAYDTIKHVAVVSENFDQAWACLLKTYDDPRKLASSYLNKFLSFQPQTGRPTAESLQAYISNVSESIASLRNLTITDLSEYLLCELALRSLDPFTREAFETSIIGITFPKFSDLQTFVQNRCHVLRMTFSAQSTPPASRPIPAKSASISPKPPNKFTPRFGPKQALMAQASSPVSKLKSCPVCHQNHTISTCIRFREATPQARVELLRQFKGCRNCLSVHHPTIECKSAYSCRICGKRHHTDLHLSSPGTSPTASSELQSVAHQKSPPPPAIPGSSGFVGGATTHASGVLLGTVQAKLKDKEGRILQFRGILDPGSQFSFMTESCARQLGYPIRSRRLHISGINGSPLENVKGLASVTFLSDETQAVLRTEAVVVPCITPPLPQTPLKSPRWDIYLTYALSDATFLQPGQVSFLIGADLFPEVVTGAPVVLIDDGPRLLPTVFGFSVMGRYNEEKEQRQSVALFCQRGLAPIMEKFWEVEETSFSPVPAPEDEACERHFRETHHRSSDGRYVVSLPFKTSPPNIVPNLPRATNYFLSLESRLAKDSDLSAQYHSQISEYLQLGHMSRADRPPCYVLPHHAVFKDVGGIKKLRIVFDASFRTATGSLNDHLLTGPKLQVDISHILLNFRVHRYVFSCDVVKMFRQIWLHPNDRRYLQVIWRDSPNQPLQFYELNTVTFGLSCSPYLAQRVLRQHALNHQSEYPEAAQVLLSNTYIDDATAGSDSLPHLRHIKRQLVGLLRAGGFELGKWSSNHQSLLEPTSKGDGLVRLGEDATTKILGMHWDPATDTFSYEVTAPPPGFTRRILLSSIARLYDPLGYLAPVVFQAKRLLQRTWTAGVDWDETLPPDIQRSWLQFVEELPELSRICILRPLPPAGGGAELLVFGDASASGYCAVAYLRTTGEDGKFKMTVLKAKTKLAPLKPLTIPRLELCAAVLVSRLVHSLDHLRSHLNFKGTYCFTDSSTVLAWLKIPPHQLQVFVGNRVQQILSNTEADWWRHIRGVDNPADVGSRGVAPSALKHHALWWTGPGWCERDMNQWPQSPVADLEPVPEVKKAALVFLSLDSPVSPSFLDLPKRFSSYPRFVRVLAYVKRFLHNVRIPLERACLRRFGEISAQEFADTNRCYIQRLQQSFYPEVFNKPFNRLSPELRRLNIFVDKDGLVRVGGRLENAPLSYDHRHPILLPHNSCFTTLILHHYHLENHHVGPAALLASIRRQYWIPRAKSSLRLLKKRCLVCTRFSKANVIPFMGQLPKSRFSNVRPFNVTGVDFAGPFMCRSSNLRRAPVEKSYLCLFLCMATRAVHLEVAVGLSVEAFLDVLDRFIMRRGKPAEMLSDGGTNFRGSDRYLREILDLFNKEDTRDQLVRHAAPHGITWNFNPPSSPHFGGGWEVCIRMVKDLLYRTFGNLPFTLPELITAFTKIEGILNSRPLQTLSDDPSDFDPLTPGHFLIGQPITALPEPDFTSLPTNRLNRWQRVRERVQHFWSRWKDEYLHSLQTRQKWDRHAPNLRLDDLVLLRDVDSSPTHWPIGRITAVHPGQDAVVRVVTVRTARGTYKRPAVKLIPLRLSDIHA